MNQFLDSWDCKVSLRDDGWIQVLMDPFVADGLASVIKRQDHGKDQGWPELANALTQAYLESDQ